MSISWFISERGTTPHGRALHRWEKTTPSPPRPSGTMDVMHRALALRIKTDMASNWRIIQRLRMSLQLALFLLLLELLAWLLAITRV
ncbi:MAG: hypothetical protein EOQ86_28455 [Mesorhizobium sp.]|nr:MAG: hypothetical protein EOQ85_26595 [Mesorhizobium sp.]RWH77175.1 MAG: hypothetical protein EOQ86_28455 [Mesorhizobium sp.]RWH86408.1 MAG: hypothetical protein EOQ87_27975 [Mesorhizobium sp.]RWH92416.1 MAG: hypothetical protein EOQ88_29670 [Mesorhizobium sp.]RWH97154.1 MAG: hypothetical protein EOQ89_27375 [Mesorhizobium sp.]